MTREQWLNKAAARMAPWFKAAGYPLPKVRISIGFTSSGMRGRSIGECWCNSASADGVFEIFIHPGQAESDRIADILAHELIHAAIGIKEGHGKLFRRLMRDIGLTGKATATVAGNLFRERWAPIADRLGPIPHAALNSAERPSTRKKKQATRVRKCECPTCGYVVRTTSKWLNAVGAPICPADNEVMNAA